MDIMDIAIAKALSGGGGGTGGGDLFVVPVTGTYDEQNDAYTYSTDIAVTDVLAALEAGKVVFYWSAVPIDGGMSYSASQNIAYGGGLVAIMFDGSELYHTADGISDTPPNG